MQRYAATSVDHNVTGIQTAFKPTASVSPVGNMLHSWHHLNSSMQHNSARSSAESINRQTSTMHQDISWLHYKRPLFHIRIFVTARPTTVQLSVIIFFSSWSFNPRHNITWISSLSNIFGKLENKQETNTLLTAWVNYRNSSLSLSRHRYAVMQQ
jgi:hypothetical protein